LFTLAG
jgi:hypothetical protein